MIMSEQGFVRVIITAIVMIVLNSCGATQSTQSVPTTSSTVTSCNVTLPAQAPQPADANMLPAMVQRGMPGLNHAFLDPLVGAWNVQMKLYIAGGTAEKPIVSTDIVACKQLIAGGRFLEDVTQGTLNGSPYYRLGLLGYNTMDKRYEWATVDALNANMMFYTGSSSSTNNTITVQGTFTDQGVLGEDMAGKQIKMRTVFQIESHNRHVLQIYFTPPNGKEILGVDMIFTRR